jgi:outer membrane lipoprotein-sorting protein
MLRKIMVLALMGVVLGSPAQAQDLDEVLGNYYEAVGGVEAWQAIQSYRMAGTQTMGPGLDAPLTLSIKRPGKVRAEFLVQGMTGVMAYDGETAWMYLPFMGRTEPEVMPDFMVKGIREQADIDGPLVGYEESGHQVELVGLEETGGSGAYKLKVTMKGGDVQYVYLDSEYIPIRIETKTVQQGREIEVETILSDYREVGGLMMPHSVEVRQKGAPAGQVTRIETVELNVRLDDELFRMPEGESQ